MKKVKLESVFINDKKADGSPLINKNGGKFKMAVIKFNGKTASKYLDPKFGAKDEQTISQWKSGDEVVVMIEQKGNFTNFSIPNKTDKLEARVVILEDKINKLLNNI